MSGRAPGSPPAASRKSKTPPILGREKQRSRTGCRTCRSRKVKCDETPGGCKNCERLNLPCPNSPSYHSDLLRQKQGGPAASNLPGTQAGLKRSRTYRSCRCCRVSKSRCSGERPICIRCRQRGLECSYDGREAPAWAEAISADLRAGSSSAPAEGPYRERTASSTPASYSADASQDSNDGFAPTSLAFPGVPNNLFWLTETELPDKEGLVLLAEEYFDNIHNLRSFGFIHKPSFMQQLDDAASAPQSPSTVLHMVCALGAKFYALKTLENVDDPALAGGFVLEAGSQWARTAHQHIFANLNNLSLDNAMAIVLLHDHELRLGNYATAFMLSGLAVRMGQALQLKSESSTDVLCRNSDGLTPSARESRRRLAWAIYVMDAWAGTPLIPEHAMRIQLPCNERNFVFELPCVVESLEVGSYLPFLSPKTRAEGSSNDLDLIAQFIRLISIRRKVLRYVRIAHTQEPPWFATSEYADLEAKLARWNERLPSSLRFDKAAIYMRKESSQLGGLLFLHFTYHQTLCDLTQLGMQDLFKTHAGLVFPVEQQEFQKAMQDQCFQHAVSISTIFDEAFRHGIDALADTWLGVVAQDSSTVIIHYISRDLGTTDKDEQFKNQAVACLHSNLRALKRMLPLYALAKPLYMSTVNVVKKHGLELPPSMEVSPVSTIEHSDRSSVEGGSQLLQFTPDHVIDPLTILSLARPSDQRISRQRPQHTVRAESTHHTLSSSLSQVTHSTGLTLDTIHASAAPVPADPQIIYEAVMPLMDGFESMDLESLQLPTSLDDLQTYFPLMIHNPTSPMQHGLLDMPPGGNGMTGFADPTAYSYPQPPTGPDLTLTGMSTAFPPVTQPQWPSGPG